MKNPKNVIRALGIATCLMSAFLMAFGEPIIGINHTGVATVLGITGLGIITSANKVSFRNKNREQ